MISFMVISGERSGSTWAANWLTTDTTLCIHDPLLRWRAGELDGIYPLMTKRKGVACTALQLMPEWVNAHPAKKIILHRPTEQIAKSLDAIGVDSVFTPGTEDRLNQIKGCHSHYEDLFDPYCARVMAEYLGVPFDAHRHAELVQMNIQPQWAAVKVTKRGIEPLLDTIRNALE